MSMRNFVQATLDVKNKKITVFWNGEIPAAITNLANRSTDGVTVKLSRFRARSKPCGMSPKES
jgi:hypothetical protein